MKKKKMTPAERERARGIIIQTMLSHVGRARSIGMGELYVRAFGQRWNHRINDTRELRRIITQLRREGTPICSTVSTSGGGYYVSSVGADLLEYCAKLRTRALKILRQEANLRQMALPELVGQLHLELQPREEATDEPG